MDNMKLIQSATVGAGGINNITFSAIPQTYTDLVVKISTKCSFDWLLCEFNGSGGTAYDQVNLRGDGTTAFAGTQNDKPAAYATITGQNVTANVFGNAELYIPNYRGSAFKCISGDGVSEANQTAAYAYLTTSVWENTGAINQIKLTKSDAGNFDEFSTAYLYGVSNITAGAGGAKATGGYVTEDTNYFYHTFLSSGTFTPTQSLATDYIIIAGGGAGGGEAYAGGGGAGGIVEGTNKTLTTTSYAVTVGGGGAGVSTAVVGNNGTDSSFNSVTAIGGGGGKDSASGVANSGGSGGGGGANRGTTNYGTSTQTSPAGHTGYGNQGGGSGSFPPQFNAGGGGGAGAVGGTGGTTVNARGTGGDGLNTWSSWASVTGTGVNGYFAGGGGGALNANVGYGIGTAGGAGGGGIAAEYNTTNVGNGVTNTGSGGGGGNGPQISGAGGSGIVIIRYAK